MSPPLLRKRRSLAALYAWLKTPGLEPVVDIGVGRRTPLQQQDSYRDNWWCGDAYQVTEGENRKTRVTGPLSFTGPTTPPLLFISAAEMATAKREWTTLTSSAPRPTTSPVQVIQWANRMPADPRVPEALHLAVTTTRYGCTDKEIRSVVQSRVRSAASQISEHDVGQEDPLLVQELTSRSEGASSRAQWNNTNSRTI